MVISNLPRSSISQSPPRTSSCATLPTLTPTTNNSTQPTGPPIILTVSRRHVRKNKYVEVSGHYHLSLLTQNQCLPLILPRTPNASTLVPPGLLDNISGLLLTEGEDISSKYFRGIRLSEDERRDVGKKHVADIDCDIWKDDLEFLLVRECMERGIPMLGICRGMQVINLVRGGDMYEDVGVQVKGGGKHIDYEDYDGFRHLVNVGEGSLLEGWFGRKQLLVTSYHHQGVRGLGKGLKGMAWSEDGLIEGYYGEAVCLEEGVFVVGLQFHPERMQDWKLALRDGAMGVEKEKWEYDGCPKVYEDFCKAAKAFHRKRSL